jgi:hypothetical protein
MILMTLRHPGQGRDGIEQKVAFHRQDVRLPMADG